MKKLNYLDFKEAVKISLASAKVTQKVEYISLGDSIGRVFSKDIICKKNLPSFNNSAMDGFALKASESKSKLKVVKTIFAGNSVDARLKQNECYKIMTGAKVPSDADTIIPIEDVSSYENDFITIEKEIKKGSCLRVKGEECSVQEILFTKGTQIDSSIVAVLASQGITTIEVYKKLTIAVVSTGDELKEPWENASEDEIYNCNSYALITLLKEKGFDASYVGVVPDNLEKSISFIKELKDYDVILTTGGISMGDADFVGKAFAQNGLETIFHGVNIKPGRPIMMGNINNEQNHTFVVGIPGNPLTAMVNMHLFVIPVLRKTQGHNTYYHDIDIATNNIDFKTKKGRVNVVLGSCNKGEYEVTQNNKYGSGMITVLSQSNSIIVTNEERACIEVGKSVKVIRFNCSYLEKQIDIFN